MTKRDVISVAVKLLGVVSIVYAVQIAGEAIVFRLVPSPSEEGPAIIQAMFLVQVLLFSAVGVVFLACASGISRRLAPDDAAIPTELVNPDQRAVFAVALRILGAMLLTYAIPGLVRNIVDIVQAGFGFGISALWNVAAGEVLSAAFGAYLLTGARALLNLLYPLAPAPTGQSGTTEGLQ